MHQKIR